MIVRNRLSTVRFSGMLLQSRACGFAQANKNSWQQFRQSQAKFGRGRDDSGHAEYESEKKKRSEQKMNWGIKNRWEQRQLDEVLKNKDVRRSQFRDTSRLKLDNYSSNISEFHSVDEIYFFLDQIFTKGFDEKHVNMALDVFLRDYGQFEEKDLEKDTFKRFVRELGTALVTFREEKSFVKTARFLDWYVVSDATLWINMELALFKKESIFGASGLVAIASHFSSQGEGSRDFYDFLEFQYNSQVFKKASTHEIVSLLYAFYQVQAGTNLFLRAIADDLLERLDNETTTYDLLRVLQAFAQISDEYVDLFVQLETLFLQRLDQMGPQELTTCACGYSISGFGTPYFNRVLENAVLQNLAKFNSEALRELARGFVFSMRGSKQLLQMLAPRFESILQDFSTNECCYLLYSYHDVGYMPKTFAAKVTDRVKQRLVQTDEVTPEELALMVKVFCTTRTAHRDFHKLLETTILMRLEDLRKDLKLINTIGSSFEQSGLCSLDTLKALKKHAFQAEVEEEVFD